jgi:hypothetical protein
MNGIFIGGSRSVTRLDAEILARLDRIIEQRLPVLVGDADGVDKAVQEYLRTKGYPAVEVFCSGGRCRNNVGGWPVRAVRSTGTRRDFAFYAAKDRQMAEEATRGLMLWDGRSKGTLMNVLRLVRQGKDVVVYSAPAGRFMELRSEPDLNDFLARCPGDLRQQVEKEPRFEARQQNLAGRTRLLAD